MTSAVIDYGNWRWVQEDIARPESRQDEVRYLTNFVLYYAEERADSEKRQIFQ